MNRHTRPFLSRVSKYAITGFAFLFLSCFLIGCRQTEHSQIVIISNRYVNNSGHDINFKSYTNKNAEPWAPNFFYNRTIVNNHTEYFYLSGLVTRNEAKDVLIDGMVDSVTVDYGHGVQATFKPLVEEPVKRNIYNEKYYEKRIIQDNTIAYEVVLTFTFTEQDYLDAQ